MLLESKDGIICDFCGITYKDQFMYYSILDFCIKIHNSIKVGHQKGKLNSDMCSHCYEKLIDDVKANLGKVRKGKIKCDLSKQYKSGSFDYNLLLFDRVHVDNKNPDKVEVDKKVMDLTLIDAYNKLCSQVDVVKKKIKREGSWS